MDSIISVIQTLGFPVACCIFLALYLKKVSEDYRNDVKTIRDEYRADVKALTDEYKEAIKSFQKALDKNTSILTELNTRLEEKQEGGELEV